MRKPFVLIVVIGVMLVPSLAWGMRTRKPSTYTNLSDPNQLTDLNNFLSDIHNLGNGRYTLENITVNPDGTRKGLAGDLVYATFGGSDHLCINTSLRADTTPTDWTCIDISVLDTCPGGFDGQVQFNDNGHCGGDAGLIWEKNLNHAALDGDGTATVDSSITLDEFINGSSLTGTQTLSVRNTSTTNSVPSQTAVLGELIWAPTAAVSNTVSAGVIGSVIVPSTVSIAIEESLFGIYGFGLYQGTNVPFASQVDVVGVQGIAEGDASGKVSDVIGGFFRAGTGSAQSGSVVGTYSLYAAAPYKYGSATPSLAYGLFVENVSGATNNYNVYSVGEDGLNVFEGGTMFGANSPSATANVAVVDIDADNKTGITTEANTTVALSSSPQTITLASGTTLATHRHNQFWAPTLNGVAGGATETVTDAATVFIDAPPSGSNISITHAADLMFGKEKDHVIRVQKTTTANTGGGGLSIFAADGIGTAGYGGSILIEAGEAINSGDGGDITLNTGVAGGGTAGDDGGNFTLNLGDGLGTNGGGGSFQTYMGDGSGTGNSGTFYVYGGNTSDTANGGEVVFYLANGSGGAGDGYFNISSQGSSSNPGTHATFILDGLTTTLPDSTTVAYKRGAEFRTDTVNGTAGGGTETCTTCATVYIDAAPSGSNITFTNGPYALFVDAGASRFDGHAVIADGAEVTGLMVVYGDETIDDGTGTGQLTVDGTGGGCLMLRDDDDAGWTRCTALNGILTCAVDADGSC